MKQFSSQGAAPGNAAHSVAAPERPSEDKWKSMSFQEKMDFARKHSSPAGTL